MRKGKPVSKPAESEKFARAGEHLPVERVPSPPATTNEKRLRSLHRVAGSMTSWRPAREVLTRVRAVPTIFPALDEATRVGGFPVGRCSVVHGPSSEGKALEEHTPVLTPSGWTPIRELKIDDRVIGGDGESHLVSGVYPQGEKDLYRVVFDDGGEVECCLEHLWFTSTMDERLRGKFVRGPRPERKRIPTGVEGHGSVKSTAEILEDFEPSTHAIPVVSPVRFDGKGALPLDPYCLGLLLGDGHFGATISFCKPERDLQESGATISFCKPERDLQERLGASLPAGDRLVCLKSNAMTVSERGSATRKLLVDLGLYGLRSIEKFVPEQYLYARVEDRIALLRGLMDTDGSVTNKGGAIDFSSSSPRLAADVIFLVRSLGGRAHPYVHDCYYVKDGVRHEAQPATRVHVSFDNGIVPISSAKHLARWKGRTWRGGQLQRRTIESITFSRRARAVCIAVDSLDRTFVTKDFIVTHNSLIALGLGLSFLKRGHFFGYIDAEFSTPISWLEGLMEREADNPLFMSLRPKSYEQAVDAVREMLKAIISAKQTGEIPDAAGIVVVDSLRALVPEGFIEKIKKHGAQGDKGSVDGMGGMGAAIKAKMNAEWFDELRPLLYQADTAMLIVGRESQRRNAKAYEPDWQLTGGRALIFETSGLLMRCERDWIRIGSGADAEIVGERHDVGIYKSKVAGKDEIVAYWQFHTSNGKLVPEGFDVGRDLLELGIELGVVKTAGTSSYSFASVRWQGKTKAVQRLHADADLRGRLEQAIRARFKTVATEGLSPVVLPKTTKPRQEEARR